MKSKREEEDEEEVEWVEPPTTGLYAHGHLFSLVAFVSCWVIGRMYAMKLLKLVRVKQDGRLPFLVNPVIYR